MDDLERLFAGGGHGSAIEAIMGDMDDTEVNLRLHPAVSRPAHPGSHGLPNPYTQLGCPDSFFPQGTRSFYCRIQCLNTIHPSNSWACPSTWRLLGNGAYGLAGIPPHLIPGAFFPIAGKHCPNLWIGDSGTKSVHAADCQQSKRLGIDQAMHQSMEGSLCIPMQKEQRWRRREAIDRTKSANR